MYQLRISAVVVALAIALPVSAQSLGDVARKEAARRKKVAKPAKVYTNDDVGGAEATAPPAAPADAAAAAPPPKPEEKPADEGPKKDEAYWRARIGEARTGLNRAKMFHDALQSRINGLSADFAARDDPAQRAALSSDRQKAVAELDRVKKEIADFEKQIRDIEDEARKAGVPPGWLR
jgi:hypothetical protein